MGKDKIAYKVLELTDDERHELFNNGGGITASKFVCPAVYKEIFVPDSEYKYFILSSGRLSGKTSALVGKWWERVNAFPDRDIVVLQATAAEIKDSLLKEIEKFLRNSGFDVGDSPSCDYYIPKSYDRIVKRGNVGETKFYPITDSKGGQRSRGVSTGNKISLVLYEEAQKNKDANVVEQSIITFMRQLDKDAQIIVVGNNETVGHWFVDFVNNKQKEENWKYIYASCYDIWELLDEGSREYVENFKKANPMEFRRIFLGDIHASAADVVFPQFTREKNYKKVRELTPKYIRYIIIGVDHATANDTFAIVPVAILDDGTAQTLEVCYDDPKETNRSIAPSEQCDILDKFVNFLDEKYGIEYNKIPTVISVDGQASPFIQQLKHLKGTAGNRRLWRDIKIKGFTMKKKDVNLGIIKNAFAYNVLTILNEGRTDWRGYINTHRLASEIEKQRYKNGKLNPAIPNDLCDALEYGLVPFYSNCYNLSFPVRINNKDNHYDDIRKTAKI